LSSVVTEEMEFLRRVNSTILRRVVLIAILSIVGVRAAVANDEPSSATPNSRLDVVLLVDSSGSMLSTDPLNLRYEGAELLLQFLDKDDQLAIVSFAGDAKVVSPLTAFDPERITQITDQIKAIQADGTYTDILAAIKAGKEVLESDGRTDSQRLMILISDGKMEPDPTVGLPFIRTQDLVNNYLPELRAKETKIHSLAFSDLADRELLSEIAGASDGLSWFTKSASEIHKSFADLFLAVKRPQVVPLTSRGFRIDGDVQEATFYVVHDEGTAISMTTPKGEAFSANVVSESIQWFAGKQFDVITVQKPEKGDWQVSGVSSNDGFATVLTNLKLMTEWPTTVRSEEPVLLTARLFDAEKPVALPSMSGVVQYAFQVSPTDKVSEPILRASMVDDGTSGDKIEKDGVFSKLVTVKEPGEYKLTIVARGPTFQRSQQLPFRVRPRLIALSVVPPTDAHAGAEHHGAGASKPADEGQPDSNTEGASAGSEEKGGHGDEHGSENTHDEQRKSLESANSDVVTGSGAWIVRVELSSEVSTFKKFEVKLTAKDAERRKYELPTKRSLDDPHVYEFVAAGLPADGQYLLQAKITAETRKRQEVEADSRPVKFERITATGEDTSGVKVILEHDSKAQREGFPVLPLVAVLLANLGIGGAMFLKVKKAGVGGGPVVARYQVPEEILLLIRSLEERAGATEVDFDDPNLIVAPDQPPIPNAPVTDGSEVPGSEGGASE
jgi:hypothetical protein